jgi:hypothetical protein
LLKFGDYYLQLSQFTFLDPACGSGNFLTETYLSLRRLENEALRGIIDTKKKEVNGQIVFGDQRGNNPIQVFIGQFYGIEINDLPEHQRGQCPAHGLGRRLCRRQSLWAIRRLWVHGGKPFQADL